MNTASISNFPQTSFNAGAGRDTGPRAKGSTTPLPDHIPLSVGSQVEVATRLRFSLQAKHGSIVGAEGATWFCNGQCWERYDESVLRRKVHKFDGKACGERSVVKVSAAFISGTLQCLADQIEESDFFAKPAVGICCTNGFVSFAGSEPKLVPHDRDQRHRFVLPGQWQPDAQPKGELLQRLLAGCFKDDDEADAKLRCLRQLAGCVVLGYATRLVSPKAFVFWGPSANNGKSQLFDVLKALVPPEARSALSLSGLCNEYYVPQLAGKLLNCCAEAPNVTLQSSDTFKKVVTGDDVEGRQPSKMRVEFKPIAQHVFAGNRLPSFRGGMDNGVLRRLAVIKFLRTIPGPERVPNIGARIAAEETDALLAWAVEGAADLLAEGGFSEPLSSKEALGVWARKADPVAAFFAEFIVPANGHLFRADIYRCYRQWAEHVEHENKTAILTLTEFTERFSELVGRDLVRLTGGKRGWRGITFKKDA